MLKLTLRRFASAALAGAAMLATGVASAQLPGITQGDSQPAPRRKDVRSGGTVPELDSRTGGGEFARDVNDRGAALGDDLHERTAFTGLVTGVSDGRLAVQMTPPRVPVAMEQVFKVTDETPVIVDGDRGTLADIRRDSVVRVITYAGDPEAAAKVVAVSTRGAKARTAAPERPVRREVASTPAVARRPAEATSGVNVWPNKEAPGVRRADVDQRLDAINNGEAAVVQTQTALRPVSEKDMALGLGMEIFDSPGEGVLVTDVIPDGPAALAGVEVGDFVMQVNGEPIANPDGMNTVIAATSPTGQVNLALWRNGQVREVAVRPVATAFGRMSTATSLRESLLARRQTYVSPLLSGVSFLDHERSGLVVGNVTGTTDLGLQRGDVLLSVNGQPVDNRADLQREMELLGSDSGTVPVVVRRNGEYVNLDLPLQAAAAGAAATTDDAAATTTETTTGTAKTGAAAARTDRPADAQTRRVEAGVRAANAPAGTGPNAARRDTGTTNRGAANGSTGARRGTSKASVSGTTNADTGTTGTGPAGSAAPDAGAETNERGQRTQGVTTPGPGPE